MRMVNKCSMCRPPALYFAQLVRLVLVGIYFYCGILTQDPIIIRIKNERFANTKMSPVKVQDLALYPDMVNLSQYIYLNGAC